MNILIVDSDPKVLRSLFAVFKKITGASLFGCGSNSACSDLIEEEFFDLVIVDYPLIQNNLLGLFTKIKNKNPKVITIILTSEKVPEELKRSNCLILPKPIDLNVLEQFVDITYKK